MHALVEWKSEDLVNMYSLTRIISPRKELSDYFVGETVRAKFGSQIYEATILEILGKYIKY
jgi:sRNA-binding protein